MLDTGESGFAKGHDQELMRAAPATSRRRQANCRRPRGVVGRSCLAIFRSGAAVTNSSPLHEPLPDDTLHVVVDMQQLFDSHPDWGSPALRRILPNVQRLVRHRPERTVYSRFVPPHEAAEALGRWRRYYERWPGVCLAACG